MARVLTIILMTVIVVTAQPALSQALPDKCLQLPKRQDVCPNLLYKKSPIAVATTETKQGEIICICMSDFNTLRLDADSSIDKINQQVDLTRASEATGISEQDLLLLIRK